MSHFATGILGMTVAALTLGGASLQEASGRSDASLRPQHDSIVYDVNRTGKADRVMVARSASDRPTVVFEHPKMPFTTIAALVRDDFSAADSKRQSANENPVVKKPAAKQRIATACERNISALAEFAKQLDAGRCIT